MRNQNRRYCEEPKATKQSQERDCAAMLAMTGIIALLICLALPQGVALGQDYYCDPAIGNITNDGSAGSPWSTAEAVFAAKIGNPVTGGDTIYLRNGYHGTIDFRNYFNNTSYITVDAESGHQPHLRSIFLHQVNHLRFRNLRVSPELAPGPFSRRSYIINVDSGNPTPRSNDLVFENLTVYSVWDSSSWSAADWNNNDGHGFYTRAPNITIRNCYIRNTKHGLTINGPYGLVEYNTIENFSMDGMQINASDTTVQYNVVKGVYDVSGNHDDMLQSVTLQAGEVFRNNIIRGNYFIARDFNETNSLVKTECQGVTGTSTGSHYEDWTIENNVVITSHRWGIAVAEGIRVNIINNTVFNPWTSNHTCISTSSGQDSIMRNNIAQDYVIGGTNLIVENNLDLDDYNPAVLFVDPAYYDLRLREGSPAIDAGSPDSAPNVDILGNPRPMGTGYDIGAYEYVPVQTTNQIEQYGITWTFDRDYPVGQFANGDYWVVGPVTITNIDPGWDGTRHGSMVNPLPLPDSHAYDTRWFGFEPSLLVVAPVTLGPDSSLISAISVEATSRPQLQAAAVLTVLGEVPPDNGATIFRPPYAGNNKPLYSTADLRKDLLPNLPITSNIQSYLPILMQQSDNEPVSDALPGGVGSVERNFQRPWIDHFSATGNFTQYSSPIENMPAYGLWYGIYVGEASMILMLDESELIALTGTNKDLLLLRYVQLGIDLYEVTENGGYWRVNSGLYQGRKWPIIFAGLMLDNDRMKTIGERSPTMPYQGFQEDGQTFYVEETPPGSDIYNYGYGGYVAADVGLPAWGAQHIRNLPADNKEWVTDYRPITGSSYVSFILPALIMGQKEAWNYDALFDYTDRWFSIDGDIRGHTNQITDFTGSMWDEYRDDYGCRWTRDDPTDEYSQGHYVCASILYGDVSENGSISGTDASMAARYSVALITLSTDQITAADVTGNGSVSGSDAGWIARKAVDPTLVFPVE